jgi:5-hydroxyisourate hydrolase
MITTHVLDTSRGRPAAGIAITLFFQTPDGWREVGRGKTDADGRLRDLTKPGPLDTGNYRITFDTGAYFPEGFYPEASVVFSIRDGAAHYHVPLLVSPFGYSTYRGS